MPILEDVEGALQGLVDSVSISYQRDSGDVVPLERLAQVADCEERRVWTCGEPVTADMQLGSAVPPAVRPTFRAVACGLLMLRRAISLVGQPQFEDNFFMVRCHLATLAAVTARACHESVPHRVALASGPGACMLGAQRGIKAVADIVWCVYTMHKNASNHAYMHCITHAFARCDHAIIELRLVRAPVLLAALLEFAGVLCKTRATLAVCLYAVERAEREVAAVKQAIKRWGLPKSVDTAVLALASCRPPSNPEVPHEPPPLIAEVNGLQGVSLEQLAHPNSFHEVWVRSVA